MKILVVGTGGVGGYYGGLLSKAGHDLFFIARGKHLKAIERNGIAVKSIYGDFTANAKAGEDPSPFGIADLIIVAVKSYDTEDTLHIYKNNVGSDTAILSLQNGTDNEEIIAREYGADKVIGGIAFVGSRVENPGVILHTAFGQITIGGLEGAVNKRIEEICKTFNDAGTKCKVSDNIAKDLMGKMVWNVGFNAICTILDKPAKETVESDDTRHIVKTAMLEWIEVANASGTPLLKDLADKNIEVTLKGGEVIPSMLHDRRLGRKVEIDTFNGKVVAMGGKYNIPTPVNMTLTGLVKAIEASTTTTLSKTY